MHFFPNNCSITKTIIVIAIVFNANVNKAWQDEKVLIKMYHYYYCYYYKFHNIINFNSAKILIW